MHQQAYTRVQSLSLKQFKLHICVIGHNMTQETTANLPAVLGVTDKSPYYDRTEMYEKNQDAFR